MQWKAVTVCLGIYGFIKEFRPAEPFITPYLTEYKNFTSEQVNEQIYPVSTYATFALLVIVFLVTDWLRYKPILVGQGLAAVGVYAMLIWGDTILVMQILEVLYGLMSAADTSYFTYMFAMAGREHFRDVAAVSRAGYLLGRFSGGVVSQATVSTGTLSLLQLQYVTVVAVGLSTIVALCLPAVKTSFYFHKQEEGSDASIVPQTKSLRVVAKLLWADFKNTYSQLYVVKWSLWWALATAGQLMVLNYVQLLWEAALDDSNDDYYDQWNGAVEAVYTVFGALAAWLATRVKSYKVWGDAILAVWSVIAGGLLLLAAGSSNIWLQYVIYSVFGTMYHGAITVASSEVAQRVPDDAQALVYGFNTFIALLVQTILTILFCGEGGFELTIRQQFYVFGGYFELIGISFAVVALIRYMRRRCGGW